MLQEFKDFINRGNVLDLAIAVIMGAAFGAITNSVVNDIIMPPIGVLLGGVNFSDLGIILKGHYPTVAAAVAAKAPVILYGKFINTVINFFIIAAVVFLIVKAFNAMRNRAKKEKDVPGAPPAPSREEVVLTEIRDLLAKQVGEEAPQS
jgi:large conductance mechanosensitive channel